MISDLSEYHHIDLVAAVRDSTYSPRMLLARLAELPDESALAAAMSGVPRGWNDDRQLLANVVDAILDNSWVTAAVAQRRRPKRPKRMWRPKSKKKQARVMTVAEMNGQRGGAAHGGSGR